MAFSKLELDPALLAAVNELGYTKPTAIQSQAIPAAMDGHDLLAMSPTGTGKTAAFLLPALQHLLDYPKKRKEPPRVLILTPTRELALQIEADAKALAGKTPVGIGSITGGVDYKVHGKALGGEVDLVVATPGRLVEYIERELFDCIAVEILVLDEADRMLEMGFQKDMELILEKCEQRRQTLLFSATLEGHNLEQFAEKALTDPVELSADPSRRERKKIHQWAYFCDDKPHKVKLLLAHLRHPETEKALVFVRTREKLAELRDQLASEKINCVWLQGEMAQDKRNNAVARFKDGRAKVLIATDVAARGLHIDDISHVINFDMPRTADIYVHRIGRTGRAGAKGTAINLVEAHDLPLLRRIERYQGEPIKVRVVDELRPKSKFKEPVKKKKDKDKKKPSAKKAQAQKKAKDDAKAKKQADRKKLRHRDTKNKGAPRRKPREEGAATE
ncbi:ATP-dependent RNA helicase SrmB [Gallaecimonas kandeliae]|uniref:ATP-dependent RNA helicase SrmB n=1 Tax=Gallaecimonas kandeliae TaxID=3029055 RepID=UPI002648F95A|nr:ATP-dependent RNA helicase SrmB [Gallaecimonas kandeliae]WKE66371.1 ATP-dependent RNA helicase SrmB [Gallaecimonas kandeliae]